MNMRNGMNVDWSRKACLWPIAAAFAWKYAILVLYMFVTKVIVYLTVPMSTLKIKVVKKVVFYDLVRASYAAKEGRIEKHQKKHLLERTRQKDGSARTPRWENYAHETTNQRTMKSKTKAKQTKSDWKWKMALHHLRTWRTFFANVLSSHIIRPAMTANDSELSDYRKWGRKVCLVCASWLADCFCHSMFDDYGWSIGAMSCITPLDLMAERGREIDKVIAIIMKYL